MRDLFSGSLDLLNTNNISNIIVNVYVGNETVIEIYIKLNWQKNNFYNLIM